MLATSGSIALIGIAPGTSVSKGQDLDLYQHHQLLHPHIHSPHPPYGVAYIPTPDVSPFFPLAYLYDVFVHASLT